jgi:hypothetical protein
MLPEAFSKTETKTPQSYTRKFELKGWLETDTI